MITPAAIKSLQPGNVLRDDVVTGLEVRAFTDRKAYYLWFRTKLGRARHPKLGDTTVMSLADAREVARSMLLKVANGADPIAERGTARSEPMLSDLWTKFWNLHAKRLKGGEDYKRMWDKLVEPDYGKVRVRAFAYEDVVDIHDGLKDTPYQANRVHQFLSSMFNFAERPLKWRELNSNPCRGVKLYQEIKRRRFATPDELKKIGDLLVLAAARDPQSAAFIYLLLYTGARPAEIEFAQRSWLEPLGDGGGVLRLPDSKTGQRSLYLPAQGMAIIKTLPAYPDGTICGRKQPAKFWRTIRRKAGCPDLRMYPDLRRSFATVTLASGESIDMVGGLLGHKTRQTTLVYARLMEDAAAASVAAGGNKMAQLLGQGKADIGNGVSDERAGHAALVK